MKALGFIKFLGSILLLGIIAYGGYFLFNQYIWKAINPDPTAEEQFVKEVKKISNIEHFDENASLNTKKPFAMLLLGVDGDDFKSNRSDTIMVAVVNPEKSKVSLLSIPRDLRVTIPGYEGHDKINAAFAKGGVDLAAKTIENEFGISLDYYATINFKGFQEMVDTIGGLEIDVEKDIKFSDRITHTMFTLEKGKQKLTGIQALNYARFRKDAEGDYGRMRRQQQVIKAIVDQTISLRNIPKIIDIIKVVDNNFDSNISYKDLGLLALKMRNLNSENIETVDFKSGPDMINGVSYVIAKDEAIQEVGHKLNDLLEE
ncbi:LCP family protein [Bacillus mexicanus]|uniref:LCP family protein n=1 Tax=Bacillus mexicanus TaxID=2834415 RepID=UPI003D21B744